MSTTRTAGMLYQASEGLDSPGHAPSNGPNPLAYFKNALKWPYLTDQTTPKATAHPNKEINPFETALASNTIAEVTSGSQHQHMVASSGSRTPGQTTTTHHHRLLNPNITNLTLPTLKIGSNTLGDYPTTPTQNSPATSSAFPTHVAALPTTQISRDPPDFKMQAPPLKRTQTASTVSSSSSVATSSRGQLHVKLLQARGLNVPSIHSRPYVVVQFEQSEFISREPIASDSEKEVKGKAGPLSRTSSSAAIGLTASGISRAFDAAVKARAALSSGGGSSAGSGSSDESGSRTPGLFGQGMSAHNPVWKHEVSFDVTSDQSMVTFTIYDRHVEGEGFLGRVEVKPSLVHDITLDQWHKLKPRETEEVTGEIRLQITYEQFKNKRALAPRDFEFMKLIGRGTFGRVFQVRKKDTRRIYAMKVLSKKEIVAKKEVAHTIGERKILQRSLECPFLVGLKFSFQTDTELYLVTDFKSGGELFWHLQKETKFSEERARFYIAELVLALEHLHKYDIVYRDLKPENILLDATGHVALCDFGLSKPDLPADQLTNTFCGTTEYLAPEVLLDDHGYSKLVDFWSLGVLLFEMCCGWSPFYAEDTQQMYKNICFGRIKFPRGVIDDDGKQFVKGLLNRNPRHRLGALRDTAELKEHPFFKTIDWTALALKQVTPPFKPVVESDESTNNFDPEFTSANLRDAGVADMFDDDDPSESWSASFGVANGSSMHQFNGPPSAKSPNYGTTNGTRPPNAKAGGPGVGIRNTKKAPIVANETPLSSSVQENFRGFTYQGESAMDQASDAGLVNTSDGGDELMHEEQDVTDPSIDDDWEDEEPAGRYKNKNGDFDMD